VPAGSGRLNFAVDLTFGPDSNLYVSSPGDDRVVRFDGVTGAFVDAFVPEGSGGLDSPGFLVDLLTPAWKLRENVTAYDAIYVALAEALDAPSSPAKRRSPRRQPTARESK
jgi:hypothetical protein